MANASARLAAALGAGALAFLGAIPAQGADTGSVGMPVRVEFMNPANFADAAERNPGDERVRDFNLDRIARYLEERAAPRLRAGQRLTIVITDVDRAGAFEPWRRNLGDVRIVRNVHPARIDLSFRLEDGNGVVLEEGTRTLRDSFFLDRWHSPHDPLRYEKALLDAWLGNEFGDGPS